MDSRFSGKVVVVTGAAQGIGAAVALRLSREGARVALLDLPGASVDATLASCRATGNDAQFYGLDVTDSEALESVVDDVVHRWKRVDLLVNNAGINGPHELIENYPVDAFDRVVAVNLRAVWLGIRAVMPHMKPPEGGPSSRLRRLLGTPATQGGRRTAPPSMR